MNRKNGTANQRYCKKNLVLKISGFAGEPENRLESAPIAQQKPRQILSMWGHIGQSKTLHPNGIRSIANFFFALSGSICAMHSNSKNLESLAKTLATVENPYIEYSRQPPKISNGHEKTEIFGTKIVTSLRKPKSKPDNPSENLLYIEQATTHLK